MACPETQNVGEEQVQSWGVTVAGLVSSEKQNVVQIFQ